MDKKISTGAMVGFGILVLVVLVGMWAMGSYNSLVRLDESAKTAQADIEVQYQRRFDLIPNLVATAQGIANLEKTVFENLANARAHYAGAPSGSSERIEALNETQSALSRLLVVVENYPELKSSESFLALQTQIEGTENRISVARGDYNDAVNELNVKLRTFPSSVIGGIFNFEQRERFETTSQAAKDAPKVEFQFK